MHTSLRTHASARRLDPGALLLTVTLLTATAGGCGGVEAHRSAAASGAGSADADTTALARGAQDLWGPAEILALVEASTVEYVVISLPNMKPEPLKSPGDYPLLHPLAVISNEKGHPVLALQTPPEEIADLLADGATRVEGGDYPGAAGVYRDVVARFPSYAKGYTFLGNALVLAGDMPEGIQALHQALALNPIDYQAHLFLASAYYRLDQMEPALEHITEAFLLNRSDPQLLAVVEKVLQANGLALAPTPLSIPGHLQDLGPHKIEVVVESENGTEWLALMLCLAAWHKEPSLQARRDPGDMLDHKMYRECLVNQAVVTEGILSQGQPVSATSRQVLAAARGGYLDAMIMWEVHALHEAAIIAVQPPAARQEIAEYIRLFVFKPMDAI